MTDSERMEQAIRERREWLRLNRDWDEDHPITDEDALDDMEDQCGRYPSGGCAYAGSEFCDWSCPFS